MFFVCPFGEDFHDPETEPPFGVCTSRHGRHVHNHKIPVWYINLHLVNSYSKCRYEYIFIYPIKWYQKPRNASINSINHLQMHSSLSCMHIVNIHPVRVKSYSSISPAPPTKTFLKWRVSERTLFSAVLGGGFPLTYAVSIQLTWVRIPPF